MLQSLLIWVQIKADLEIAFFSSAVSRCQYDTGNTLSPKENTTERATFYYIIDSWILQDALILCLSVNNQWQSTRGWRDFFFLHRKMFRATSRLVISRSLAVMLFINIDDPH